MESTLHHAVRVDLCTLESRSEVPTYSLIHLGVLMPSEKLVV